MRAPTQEDARHKQAPAEESRAPAATALGMKGLSGQREFVFIAFIRGFMFESRRTPIPFQLAKPSGPAQRPGRPEELGRILRVVWRLIHATGLRAGLTEVEAQEVVQEG